MWEERDPGAVSLRRTVLCGGNSNAGGNSFLNESVDACMNVIDEFPFFLLFLNQGQ